MIGQNKTRNFECTAPSHDKRKQLRPSNSLPYTKQNTDELARSDLPALQRSVRLDSWWSHVCTLKHKPSDKPIKSLAMQSIAISVSMKPFMTEHLVAQQLPKEQFAMVSPLVLEVGKTDNDLLFRDTASQRTSHKRFTLPLQANCFWSMSFESTSKPCYVQWPRSSLSLQQRCAGPSPTPIVQHACSFS